MSDRYKVVLYKQSGGKRTVQAGLTLEQAQKICNDPETSSQTCTKAAGKARTRRLGCEWFYGYTKE